MSLRANHRRTEANTPLRDRRYGLAAAAITWMVILLMVVPVDLNYSGFNASAGPNPLSKMLWLMVLAVGWFVVFARSGLSLRVLRETNIYFRIFLVLATCSVLWSIAPAQTVQKLARLLIQFGAFLALAVAAWHPRRFQNVIRPVLTLLLLGSLIFGLASPELAIHQDTAPELLHSWHGLAVHKNGLGLLAAVGTLMWIQAFLAKDTGRLSALFGIGVSVACLILSRSSTCMMAAIFSCCTLLVLMQAPGSMRRGVRYFRWR